MAIDTPAQAGPSTLRRTLSTPKIVFLVVAAAGPMAAMVGTVPLAFTIGNGAGVPAAFAFAGLTLLCFSVGYAAMSRHVVNTGGFYTYMARGLGRPPAVAGGLVAVIAYNTVTIGLVGAFGYFAALIGGLHGIHWSWMVWAAGATALMAVLGYRQIDISIRMMAVLMLCEVGILVLLDLAIVVHKGAAAFPATSFAPHTFLASGLGVALMFASISFIGYESAAQYGEEARDPRRSVPMATYLSVLIIAVFYTLTSWTAVGEIGAGSVRDTAGQQLGQLFFGLSTDRLGSFATTSMQVLLCTSLFAAMLALHNAANRYMYVLGREHVLPGTLGAVHPRHGSPHRASVTQTALCVVVVSAFAAAGLDPYTSLSTSMVGLGTLGIVALQAMAALSVLGFFRRHPDRHWWRTGLAPLLGLAGLVVTVVLLVKNFSLVTGTTSTVINLLPWVIVLTAVGGFGYAFWMRSARPQRYASLADVDAPGTVDAATPREARELMAESALD
jgi:amino acid transporter